MENNIKQFDEVVGQLFGRLYSTFPKPEMISYIQFAGFSDEDIGIDGSLPEEAELYRDTIEWLNQEGYLLCRDVDRYVAIGVTLSQKALEALRTVPSSLEGKKSIGERLGEAASAGGNLVTKESVKQLASLALSTGIGIITKG